MKNEYFRYPIVPGSAFSKTQKQFNSLLKKNRLSKGAFA